MGRTGSHRVSKVNQSWSKMFHLLETSLRSDLFHPLEAIRRLALRRLQEAFRQLQAMFRRWFHPRLLGTPGLRRHADRGHCLTLTHRGTDSARGPLWRIISDFRVFRQGLV